MNLTRYALMFCLCCVYAFNTSAQSTTFTCAGSVISLLDSTEAAAVSQKPDAYTHEHTPFDLSIRLDRSEGLNESDYLAATAKSVRNWPKGEQEQLKKAFASIDLFVKTTGAHLHLPDTIKIIKTTSAEEFGAEGYTRENRIMLNTNAQPIDLHLVAHELWHVISRMNPILRNNAYAVFHFKPCNNIVYKPAMKNHVITNPDCPFLMNYITITKDGKKQDVALMLYSKNDFHNGYRMEQYANIGLLALTGDDEHKTPLLKDGNAVVYELSEPSDFFSQVGSNTQYMLHVEEITAEHFAAVVNGDKLPQMEYLTGVRAVLME
jgi:hypothetical protein